jgi:hypothetical protein
MKQFPHFAQVRRVEFLLVKEKSCNSYEQAEANVAKRMRRAAVCKQQIFCSKPNALNAEIYAERTSFCYMQSWHMTSAPLAGCA